jgi:glycosyltransferase involved in cell wall biosynthesis
MILQTTEREDVELSIIIPVFNEEGNIELLYGRLHKILERINKKYEIILVDDGSTDSTHEKMVQIQKRTPTVRIIKFRRNFGKAFALNVAFRRSRGEIIVTMDGDLQDDPLELPRFISKIEEGYDLVSGWKYPRLDPITKTLPSKFFNRLTCLVTGVSLNDFNCGYKAYRRIVVKNLILYGEMHRYIPALAAWNGFTIAEIKIKHHPRHSGRSKYGFSRLLKGLLDLITVKFLTNYASRPLHAFGIPGFVLMIAGTLVGMHLAILKYVDNIEISERPLLMVGVMLILIGFQFISLGLLGEMITYDNMRNYDIDRHIDMIS